MGGYRSTVPDICLLLKAFKLRLNKKKFTHLLILNEGTYKPYGTIFVDAVKLTKRVS